MATRLHFIVFPHTEVKLGRIRVEPTNVSCHPLIHVVEDTASVSDLLKPLPPFLLKPPKDVDSSEASGLQLNSLTGSTVLSTPPLHQHTHKRWV